MKVTGPGLGGTPRVGGASGRAASGGGSFPIKNGGAARESAAAARTAGPSHLTSLDALLALQEVDGPTERRRRAVKRGTRILDQLEAVKLAVLDGDLPPETLRKLSDVVREQRAATEDPKLEGVLDEIETRAAVELAKRELRAGAAGT